MVNKFIYNKINNLYNHDLKFLIKLLLLKYLQNLI